MSHSIIRKCFAATLVLPLVVHAQIYKWQDDHGRTVFGNHPPAYAREVKAVDLDLLRPGSSPAMVPATPTADGIAISGPPSELAPVHSTWPGTVDRSTVDAVARNLTQPGVSAPHQAPEVSLVSPPSDNP